MTSLITMGRLATVAHRHLQGVHHQVGGLSTTTRQPTTKREWTSMMNAT